MLWHLVVEFARTVLMVREYYCIDFQKHQNMKYGCRHRTVGIHLLVLYEGLAYR